MKFYSPYLSALLLQLVCSFGIAYAQKPEVKFGKVSLNELKMQVYEKDTSAGAVVLFDGGHFSESTFNFTRFFRVKILKNSGLYRANIVVYTPYKSNVSGYTYNLSATGEVIKEKLKPSSIYVQQVVDDFTVLKIAMPNVKVGSVIDLEYTHPGLPFQWEFQDQIPVLWSELRIDPSPYFSYQKNMFGLVPLYINDKHYWAAKEVPALKPEKHMGSTKNFITRFEFELTHIKNTNYDAANWEGVSRILMRSPYFGQMLSGNAFLNSIADSIISTSKTDLERVQKAVALIKAQMLWNEQDALVTDIPLWESFKKKKPSTSASLNFTLVALLKKMKLEAHPLVLSTRQNGFIPPVYPALNKLNHVIAYVKVGDDTLFIDATEKNVPLGMLPVKCLNLHGQLIDKEFNRHVVLEPTVKYKKTYLTQISIPEDLSTAQYNLTVSNDGYAALEKRNTLSGQAYNVENFKTDFGTTNNATVTKYEFTGLKDLEKPLVEKISAEQGINKSGNFLFVTPLMALSFLQNPFYPEDRLYPIDFMYPVAEKYTAHLIIPAGYEVETVPENLTLVLPEQAGRLLYQASRLENGVQLRFSFELNQRLFSSTQYPEIKKIFEQYARKAQEQIVLKKKANL